VKKKSKPKKIYAVCPACGMEKHRTEMTTAVSTLEKLERQLYRHYKEMGLDPYNSFINADFEWACDKCLSEKRAIPANPSLQVSLYNNLAYHDTKSTCRKCGEEFLFKKEEKQLWYEGLKFGSYSAPVNCLKCRREIRQLKAENQVLTDILKKEEEEISISELEQVAEVYRNWGKDDRAKYYEALIKKKRKKTG
jgi:hypothetical protein